MTEIEVRINEHLCKAGHPRTAANGETTIDKLELLLTATYARGVVDGRKFELHDRIRQTVQRLGTV